MILIMNIISFIASQYEYVYNIEFKNKTSVIVMAKKSLSNVKYLVSYLDLGGRPLIRFDKRILNLILVIQRN